MSEDQTPPPGTKKKLSPDEVLELHPKRPRPIQLSIRSVLVIVGGVSAAIIIVVLIGILINTGGRSESTNPDRTPSHLTENAIQQQESLAYWPEDYAFLRNSEPDTEGVAPPELPAPVLPEVIPEVEDDSGIGISDRERELLEAMIQRMQEGFDSPLVFQVQAPRWDLNPGLQAIAHRDTSFDRSSLALGRNFPVSQSDELFFLRNPGQLPDRVSGTLQSPLSPYELRAGSVLPAALITAIHSDLPGDLIAQVTENVYDAETGEHLLIPQGSRLIGTYNNEIPEGRNRVLVVWQRLILPNGKSIGLDAMPGVDLSGAAGLHDRVDYHLENVAGATVLSSLIAFTGNLARSQSRDGDALSVVGETVAQESSRFGNQIIDRELRRPPTITVRSGTEFNVLVNRDIPLEPYQVVRGDR